jgi:thiol-disulfide isomerase/thioredoxin
MKHCLVLISLFLNVAFAFAGTDVRKEVKISGTVINMDSASARVITIIPCDPLENTHRQAFRLNIDGKFEGSFPMLWAHDFTISYNGKFINVYAEPGDCIRMEIDSKKFSADYNNAITFSGDRADFNNKFCKGMCAVCQDIPFVDLPDTTELSQYMPVFKDKFHQYKDRVLNSYCRENAITEDMKHVFSDMILYTMSNYALGYRGKNGGDGLAFLRDSLFDMNNESHFRVMMFPYHLYSYVSQLMSPLSNKYRAEKVKSGYVDEGIALLLKEREGRSRDLMMYHFLRPLIKEFPDKVKGYIEKKKLFSEYIFNKSLIAIYEEMQRNTTLVLPVINNGHSVWSRLNGTGGIENYSKESIMDFILKKHKGKVIYVDFWATWCGPCRAEMPEAKGLHQFYKGKNIVFVNICLKSDKKKWAEMVVKDDISGENYYVENDMADLLMSKYNMSGVPTYKLIGRDGKLIDANAPRPSNFDKLTLVIEKALKE